MENFSTEKVSKERAQKYELLNFTLASSKPIFYPFSPHLSAQKYLQEN
jgi:hypothetical protein